MCGNKSNVFIPDVSRILRKYDLTQFLDNFLDDSTFPGKLKWKKKFAQYKCYHSKNPSGAFAWP